MIHPGFHVSLFEPYHEPRIRGRVVPPTPPPIDVDSDIEYEVEEVL